MIRTYTQGKLTWVDAMSPTSDEIRELLETYELPLELLGDLGTAIPRSESVSLGKVIKITMNFPIVKRTDMTHPHDVKFIITKNVLISVRYEDIEAIHRFQKEFEVLTMLYKTKKGAHGSHLFFSLLRELYISLDAKLDYLESKLSDVKSEMMDGKEKETIFSISDISKRLITFRQVIKAHDNIFMTVKKQIAVCFSESLAEDLVGLHEQYFSLMRRTNALFESVEEIRSTHFALLTMKQNEIMKILTIMAFITFPLTLFTSMFGMNTVSAPIIGSPWDFWVIVGIMSVGTVCFFSFFKYKHWI